MRYLSLICLLAVFAVGLSLSGCDQTPLSLSANSSSSGIIGPDKVELNCAYQNYDYSGLNDPASYFAFVGPPPAGVTLNGNVLSTGGTIGVAELGYYSGRGGLLDMLQIEVKNQTGATCVS